MHLRTSFWRLLLTGLSYRALSNTCIAPLRKSQMLNYIRKCMCGNYQSPTRIVLAPRWFLLVFSSLLAFNHLVAMKESFSKTQSTIPTIDVDNGSSTSERALMLKIDLWLLPCVVIIFLLSFLDKSVTPRFKCSLLTRTGRILRMQTSLGFQRTCTSTEISSTLPWSCFLWRTPSSTSRSQLH